MFDFFTARLLIAERTIERMPKMTVVGILHALSDTREFLSHLLRYGHEVPLIFAKPFSKNAEEIAQIERMGVRVEQLDYETLEGTSVLLETIRSQMSMAKYPLVLVDVGGYFAKPLAEMSALQAEKLPIGVLEVTTYGHNRYVVAKDKINTPIVSIARSPIKDVEATFVGESAWFAIDSVFREVGMSVQGKKVGIVGYGMIGRRVAETAKANGVHTLIFDTDPLKLLDARSFKHQVSITLERVLTECSIVVSATGSLAISLSDMLSASDGIVLASAGSKANELDMAGLRNASVNTLHISKMITEYTLASKKRIRVLRNGAAVNFLLGSCPDQTMDLVFSEMAEGCKRLVENNLEKHAIHEVGIIARQRIAREWLELIR